MIPKKRTGIPYKVRANDSDYSAFTITQTFKEKPVSYKKQNEVFAKYLENPFREEYYTYLLSSDYNNIIPQLPATATTAKAKAENKVVFWYNVIKNHKQEDERLADFLSENLNIDLLIIDGLYTKTNVNNIDKVRELLALFDNIPIYVIISGGFGPEFFINQVFCPFNVFIHFGDSPRRTITEI